MPERSVGWLVELIGSWAGVRSALGSLVGSYPRAEACMEGMKLQAYYGECFAGTKHLGAKGYLSTKAVQRTLRQLAALGLISREREVRATGARTRGGRAIGGTLGVYNVDWRPLWRKALAIWRAWQRRWREMVAGRRQYINEGQAFREWFGSARDWLWDPGGG